ncbi:MAG TPA: VWA domain-containing protein, partial [Terriglobales bacterium]|nr:VWA domain-containing protein [Terriglobales bacterium]
QGKAGPEAQRLTIVALDTINTPFLDQTRGREALVKYLVKNLDRGPVTLLKIYPGGVSLVFDFTTNPEIIRAGLTQALKQNFHSMQGSRPTDLPPNIAEFVGELQRADPSRVAKMISDLAEAFPSSTLQRNTIEETLEALRHIAGVYGGLPGRKSLLWLTAGFPFDLDPKLEATPGSVTWIYDRTFQQLSDADVAVYPVNLKGMEIQGTGLDDTARNRGTSIADPTTFSAPKGDEQYNLRMATLNEVASRTGGQAYYYDNDLPKAFEKAEADASAYYMLAYYLDRANTLPGWHKLQVKTERKGANLRARSGFFTGAPGAPGAEGGELAVALNSPFDYTELPLTVRWLPAAAGPGDSQHQAACEVVLPAGAVTVANNHVSVEFLAVARDRSGNIAAQFSQQVSEDLKPDGLAELQSKGLTYHNALQLPPGDYQVRFVVRDDASGRIGSVLAPLKVEQPSAVSR